MNIAKTPTVDPRKLRAAAGSVQTLARTYKSGARLDPHMHREAQLVFAAKGVMQVQTPRGVWLVPPERAVWVPPRLEHAIDVLSDLEMRTLYFQPRWLARQKAGVAIANEFVVRVGALMREAILAMFEPQCDALRTSTLAQLVVMELRDAGDASTFMPMPLDAKARHVANLILRDPAADRGLEQLAAEAGISGTDEAHPEIMEAARPRDRGDRAARPAGRLDQAGGHHARLLLDRRLQLRVSQRHR
jgi:quercetin dioxygenase-like cupin family protein